MQAHGKFPLLHRTGGGCAHVSVGNLGVGMMGISSTTFVDMQRFAVLSLLSHIRRVLLLGEQCSPLVHLIGYKELNQLELPFEKLK